MTAADRDVIPSFDALSSSISLYRSNEAHLEANRDDPSLIVLCSWGWAKRRYIAKYTEEYRQLFPCSDILLVESAKSDFIWRPRWMQRARLATAAEVINSTLNTSNNSHSDKSRPSILWIAMSDGGCNSIVNLTMLLQRQLPIRVSRAVDSSIHTPWLTAFKGPRDRLSSEPPKLWTSSCRIHRELQTPQYHPPHACLNCCAHVAAHAGIFRSPRQSKSVQRQ